MDPTPREDQIALGFDIGGSRTKVGLVNRAGKILSSSEFPSNLLERSREAFLLELKGEILNQLGLAKGGVLGIGASFLGWIDDARTGPFLCSNAPELHGFNLKRFLEEEFHLPVVLNDDATAHVLAEHAYGCGQGVRRFMSMAMGTGLGVGVILNGHPLTFTAGCVGDAGHMILRPGGPVCSSGCHGCGEALIGVAGIEQLGLEKYGYPKTAREIIQAAGIGDDPVAVQVMMEIGGYTGELLASISHIFLPDRIALTGGTTNAGSVLLDAVRHKFDELVGDYHRNFSKMSNGYYHGVEIVFGTLKGETGLIGSVVEIFKPSGSNTRH